MRQFVFGAWYLLVVFPAFVWDPIDLLQEIEIVPPDFELFGGPEVRRLILVAILLGLMFVWFHRQRLHFDGAHDPKADLVDFDQAVERLARHFQVPQHRVVDDIQKMVRRRVLWLGGEALIKTPLGVERPFSRVPLWKLKKHYVVWPPSIGGSYVGYTEEVEPDTQGLRPIQGVYWSLKLRRSSVDRVYTERRLFGLRRSRIIKSKA